jgi:hypothetical protein
MLLGLYALSLPNIILINIQLMNVADDLRGSTRCFDFGFHWICPLTLIVQYEYLV